MSKVRNENPEGSSLGGSPKDKKCSPRAANQQLTPSCGIVLGEKSERK